MINDWQQDLIPQIQSERDFSILNSILPKLQSTNDEDQATEHIKKLNVFVPIHSKSSNWRCILIQFPSNDKFSNGVVNLYDLNDKKSGESSTLKGITMWYAKLFGMIWNNVNNEIFTKDMVLDLFKKADRKNVQWHDEITTLNHKHHMSEHSDSISREHSGFNIAIMLFLKEFMAMTTASKGFDIPTGKGGIWQKYLSNFKLYVLNVIIDILTIMNPSIPQEYIYDPENNNCEDNVIIWRKCLSMVKDDKLSEDKIWDEMRKQCDEMNTKSNKSLKGIVDVNSERYVSIQKWKKNMFYYIWVQERRFLNLKEIKCL